jgi:glycine dehydrogenase
MLRAIAEKNEVWRSCIGAGYHGTITPGVILRNMMENPGGTRQYTPVPGGDRQGRLEALLNFQTVIADLTGMEIAGASLLDEATAAAEAMAMCVNIASTKPHGFFAASTATLRRSRCVRTRARYDGHRAGRGRTRTIRLRGTGGYAGVLLQYPTTDGRVQCYRELCDRAHAAGTQVVAAPTCSRFVCSRPRVSGGGHRGGQRPALRCADGGGGPHAGYIATSEKHVRKMPGRLVGVSKDAHRRPALRLAIQTREQHIRRDRATSNICTAQVLLAVMAGMYGMYHGPTGLRRIAERVRTLTQTLRAGLEKLGHDTGEALVFDTLRVAPTGRTVADVVEAAARAQDQPPRLRRRQPRDHAGRDVGPRPRAGSAALLRGRSGQHRHAVRRGEAGSPPRVRAHEFL